MSATHKQLVERAGKRREKAMQAVYASTPNNTTPFYDCLTNAPLAIKDEFDAAHDALWQAECAAVDAGKAWRGTFGMLQWYTRPVRSIRARRHA